MFVKRRQEGGFKPLRRNFFFLNSSKRKFHTYIYLNYTRVKFLSYKKIK